MVFLSVLRHVGDERVDERNERNDTTMSERNVNGVWEYKTVSFNTNLGVWGRVEFKKSQFNLMLNEQGQEGWELVSTTGLHELHGRTTEVIVVFKRPARS